MLCLSVHFQKRRVSTHIAQRQRSHNARSTSAQQATHTSSNASLLPKSVLCRSLLLLSLPSFPSYSSLYQFFWYSLSSSQKANVETPCRTPEPLAGALASPSDKYEFHTANPYRTAIENLPGSTNTRWEENSRKRSRKRSGETQSHGHLEREIWKYGQRVSWGERCA